MKKYLSHLLNKRYIPYIPLCSLLLLAQGLSAQTGYIYVHQKNINEESSVDFNFALKNSSGATINTWQLNDQATSDNVALSGNNIYAYDAGVSHGTGADGQLWVIAATSGNGFQPGSVYTRSAAASTWSQVSSLSSVTAIDGAYANQFVYSQSSSSNVYFYYNGTTTTLPSVGATVTDVTANGGRIAAVAGSTIYLYSASYTSSSAPSTGGTWTALVTTGQVGIRIDMNSGATSIAYVYSGTTDVYTTTFTGVTTDIGTPDAGSTGEDVAYDDNGNIYTICVDNSNGPIEVVASYNGSSWTAELPSRYTRKVTGGAAHAVWGVQWNGGSWPQTIWYRATDNTGTAYWIDDERIKNSSSLNGNGIIIPVAAGTYTIQETLPNSTWDLGRFNLYDPGNASTVNVANNSASVTVTAGEVVYVEFVNEKLNPKVINLSCTSQYLETFDATTSSPIYTYTYGSSSAGTPLEGTAYHYDVTGGPADGYYSLVKGLDHTGNNGYGLFVNASYAKDEFYRQRVTGLVTGLQYSISFYGFNVSPTSPIAPNVEFGLQDLSGNIINQATTGNFPTNYNWYLYSFTFTATTDTADLFLRNQNIGGNGNDLVIDDISLNPAMTPLGNNTISPAVVPDICIGTNYTFSNSTSGGTWSVSPTSVVTMNSKTGQLHAAGSGNAIVTYTYTNSSGCASTSSSTVTVSAPPAVSVSDQLGGTSCLNQTDSLYTTISGGVTPYSYSWAASPSSGSGLSTANIANTAATPTAANTYTFTQTATDAGGCTASASVSVVVSSHSAPTVTASATGPYCSGTSFNLSSAESGGSGSYTYTWSGTPTGNGLGTTNTKNTTATPTTTGTYTYSILVNDGFCKVPKSVLATVNSSPAVSVTGPSGTQQVCGGGSFAISSLASGGGGTYTYAWTGSRVSGPDNPGSAGLQSPTNTQNVTANPTLTSSTSGNPDVYKYAVVVTDGNGCMATGSANVTAYLNSSFAASALAITSPASATSFCLGSSVTLTATGTLPGAVIGAASTDGYPLSNAFDGTATTFYDYGIGNGGWVGLDLGSAQVISSITYYPRVGQESRMIGGQFQGSNVANFSSGVTTFYTISSTPSDAYHIVSSGSASAFRYVRYLAPNGSYGNIAELIFSGTPSLTYAWTANPSSGNGLGTTNVLSTTATPTSAGSYVYTISATDNNGCVSSATTPVVTVNANPSVTAGTYATALCSNTVDSVYSSASGGKSPYTYAWTVSGAGTLMTVTSSTKDTSSITGGTTGDTYTFTMTATDANGCTGSANTSIQALGTTQGPTVSGMASVATDCINSAVTFNPTIGKLSGTVIGAASTDGYPLSNAFDGNTATFYDYGTASGGWVGLDLGTATVISGFRYYPRATLESRMVGGEFQGSNVADFSSGVTTFYTITSTPADQYYTVSSGSTMAFRYVRYLSPSGSYGNIAELVFYNNTGGNTYLWTASPSTGSGLATTNDSLTTVTPTAAGSYTYNVKVTNSSGCSASASTGVQTVNPAISVSVIPSATAFCGTSGSTALTAIVSGGSGSYAAYLWFGNVVSGAGSTTVSPSYSPSTNVTTATFSGATAGSSTFQYEAEVFDGNSCLGTGYSPTISVLSSPTVNTITASTPFPCLGQTTNLSSSFSGGTAPYSYSWSAPTNATIATPSGTTSPANTTATISATGNYVFGLQLVDANNCIVSAVTGVATILSNPAASLVANKYSVCDSPSATINLTGTITTSTTSPYTYAWSGSGVVNNTGSITTTAAPTTSGVDSLTVTDANGCSASASTPTISVDQATPSISVDCNSNSVQLFESTGTSWYWTTASGGPFYPDNTYSPSDDSSTSHLEGPFIKFMGNYSVQITDAAGCIGSGSVTVSQCNSLLAVNLLEFTAHKEANQALLEWSTTSETNNKYFDIERSADGINWQSIGTVQGQGTTNTVGNYTYTDQLPLNGINYYRLKQVDDNGVYTYSTIRSLDFSGLWLVKLYPNPAQSFIMLEFNNDKNETASIIIQNVQGAVVFTTQQQVVKGFNQINLNQVQRLAQGTYLITMGTASNIFRSKFIKGGN